MWFWRNFSWQFLNRGPDKAVQQNRPILSKTFPGSLEDTSKNPKCMLVMENSCYFRSWKVQKTRFYHFLTYSPLFKVKNIIHFSWPTCVEETWKYLLVIFEKFSNVVDHSARRCCAVHFSKTTTKNSVKIVFSWHL